MNRLRWAITGLQIAASTCVLSLAVGCGGGEVAGTDPADREKTMTDAKNAMEEAGKLQKAAKTKHTGKR